MKPTIYLSVALLLCACAPVTDPSQQVDQVTPVERSIIVCEPYIPDSPEYCLHFRRDRRGAVWHYERVGGRLP